MTCADTGDTDEPTVDHMHGRDDTAVTMTAAVHGPMSIMQVFTAGTAVHAIVSMSCLDANLLWAHSRHAAVISGGISSVMVPACQSSVIRGTAPNVTSAYRGTAPISAQHSTSTVH